MPARRRRGLAPPLLVLFAVATLAVFNALAARRAEARNPAPGRLIRSGSGRVHLIQGGAGRGARCSLRSVRRPPSMIR